MSDVQEQPRSILRWIKSSSSKYLTFKQTDFGESARTETTTSPAFLSDSDEFLVSIADVKTEITQLLERFGCQVAKVEIRKRLSTQEYLAYITIRTSMGIERLHDIENVMRNRISNGNNVLVRNFFWNFTPD